jgi:hypothetical protein
MISPTDADEHRRRGVQGTMDWLCEDRGTRIVALLGCAGLGVVWLFASFASAEHAFPVAARLGVVLLGLAAGLGNILLGRALAPYPALAYWGPGWLPFFHFEPRDYFVAGSLIIGGSVGQLSWIIAPNFVVAAIAGLTAVVAISVWNWLAFGETEEEA